jgi:hypothetical protein
MRKSGDHATVGQFIGQASRRGEHAERHDEGRDPKQRDADAVDEADGCADQGG